jgi:glycosyltransferase involved in cell wall biosynthesis
MKVILYNDENRMEVAQNNARSVVPKRVLYVITKSNWGGAQRYVYDLATAAKAAGHTVAVVSGREGELTDRLREAGVAVFPIPSMQRNVKLASDFKVLRELLAIIRDFKPDVIHGNSSKAGALVSFAGRMRGIHRIIFTAHGWAFNEERPWWQKFLIGIIHYITVLLSHTTICNSSATMRDIRWMPFVKSKIVVIHHGVHQFTMLPRQEARAKLAPTLGERIWIGVIAELHPIKGLDALIQAVEHVAPDYGEIGLVIIGEGEERGYLEHLIKIEGVTGRIVLAGHVVNAPQYLSAFDLFILPSRSESLGYALLEAGMAGLPAIGTKVGGIPEILEEEKTGLLVPPNDPPALYRAIERILKDKNLKERLAENLHAKVVHDFSPEQMHQKTFALY